ncbi:MAG: HAMP domain-containing histidine kinase [Bacteroidia bacterium]|nr:HAMP domain-containing histidine kinase [Bacteroidia bacterium]
MNKTRIKIIIGIMSLALLGLVAIQFFWIRHALELRAMQFRDNVNLALTELDSELGGNRVKQQVRIQREFVQPQTHGNDSMRIVSRIVVSDSGDVGSFSWNGQQESNQVIELLHEGDEPGQEVEVILDKLLKDKGIDVNYEAIIVSGKSHQIFFQEDTFDKKNNIVFRRMLDKPGEDEPEMLTLRFKDPNRAVLDSMGLILPTSGLIILIISLCFGLTLAALFRTKKLSDMKSDFINNMTHELKTPISTISLASEALRDPVLNGNQEKVSHFAAVIQEENERLKLQVERVLEMARMDRGELKLRQEKVDLAQLVSNEVQRIQPAILARKGKLSFTNQATQTEITGDPVHLAGIFANLLDNANKYSPQAPQITVNLQNQGQNLLIQISDLGPGMSREVQKRIFERFYRVPTGNRHDVKGFGLGLSYVKAMCEAHGGSISVKSEPGQGSTFTVQFPLQAP